MVAGEASSRESSSWNETKPRLCIISAMSRSRSFACMDRNLPAAAVVRFAANVTTYNQKRSRQS